MDLEWATIEELELEVPGVVVGGGDGASADPQRFQRRRCLVSLAVLRTSVAALQAVVGRRDADLQQAGFNNVVIRPGQGCLEASGSIGISQPAIDFTARVFCDAHGAGLKTGLRIGVAGFLCYGSLRRSAPLVCHDLLCSVLGAPLQSPSDSRTVATPNELVSVSGLGQALILPLEAALWQRLPQAGWRLPDCTKAPIREIQVDPLVGVRIRYQLGEPGRQPDHVATAAAAAASDAAAANVAANADDASVYGAAGSAAGDAAAAAICSDAPGTESSSTGGTVLSARSLAASFFRSAEALRDADQSLLRGDLDGALTAYRACGSLDDSEEARLATERALAVLCARATTLPEAEKLAHESLVRWPDFSPAFLALATAAVERNRGQDAAEHFARIWEIAKSAGNDDEALHAALSVARRLSNCEADKGAPFYEYILERQPENEEAVAWLIGRYGLLQRWEDLVRLLRHQADHATENVEKAQALFRLGELFLDRLADPERARQTLSQAVALDAGNAACWEALGRVLAMKGDVRAAIDAFGRLLDLQAGGDDTGSQTRAHLRLAELEQSSGNEESSAEHLGRILELSPDDIELVEQCAVLADRSEHKDVAIACFQRLAELFPAGDRRRNRALRELGRLYLDGGSIEEARQRLEEAAQASPPDTDSLVALALLEEKAERPEVCVAVLARAVASATDDVAADLELLRARVLENMGDESGCRAALENAYRLSPDSSSGLQAARRLALSARLRGDIASEASWLQAWLEHGGGEDDQAERGALLVRHAELLLATGDAASAAERLAVALPLVEPRRDARRLLAQALGVVGDHQGRAAQLDMLAEEETDESERAAAFVAAAEAYLAFGTIGEAVARARRALELAPDNLAASRIRAEAAWQSRSWDDIVTAYRALLPDTAANERAEAGRRLGMALERCGREEEAIAAYRAAVDTAEANGSALAAAWRRLADLYERQGDFRLATETLTAAARDERTGEPATARAKQRCRAAELLRDRLGDTEKAALLLEEALRSAADFMPALDSLELIHARMGDYEKVAGVLGRKIRAAARRPDLQKVLLARLADVQDHALGRPEAAREAHQRALELDALYRPSLRYLAGAARECGDVVAAEDYFGRLASIPDDCADPA
ncbi:MAG: hypothetical protein V2A73_07955, partial [Pseudomonadota bacterium]